MPHNASPIVHVVSVASSTQRVARDLLSEGTADVGHVVVADRQTDGRGRRGRAWASPRGGLYATFIVPHELLLSLRAGVAAATALHTQGAEVRLKWPNDLVVGERKLGGILVESDAATARVGVGINLSEAPVAGAICLADLGVHPERDVLVYGIYDELVRRRSDADIASQYRALSATLGRRVLVSTGAEQDIEGRAIEIDEQGRLVIEVGDCIQIIACGDCVHADIVDGSLS